MGSRWALCLLGLCVFVLLETTMAQTPKDVNECAGPNGISCGQNADCVNTEGSYHCTCISGYTLPSGEKTFPNKTMNNCQDADECSGPKAISCGLNALCVNTPGSYYCKCSPGYALPSGEKTFTNETMNKCQVVDTCLHNSSLCAPHGVCKNQITGYTCECKPGFNLFNIYGGYDCKDVNECAGSNGVSCGQNATCVNTKGSYYCECIFGYTLPSGEKTFPNVTMNKCQEPRNDSDDKNISFQFESFLNHSTTKNKTEIGNEVTILLMDLEKAALKSSEEIQKLQKNSFLAFERREISNCSQENVFTKLKAQNNSAKILCMDIIHSNTQDPHRVAFLSYSSLGTIINASFYKERHRRKSDEIYLNSKVVSTAIEPSRSELHFPSVILEFQHIKHLENIHQIRAKEENHLTLFYKKKVEKSPLCVYWEAEGNEGGVWSTAGCKLIKYNQTHTSCNCTHLSSFAVLMASYSQEEDFTLTVITYVGLSLSLLCLFLASLTFLLCPTIQNTSTSLHLQLSLCLFLAHLLFLIGIEQTENKVLCSIIAGLLHYLYLAAFTWMLLEGLHLFLTARNLMVVNYSRVNQSLKKIMYPLGYGLPAVIVAISAASRADFYGSSSHCWLQWEKGFIWAFLGPVCVIVSVNFIFFLLVLWILQSKLSSLNNEVSTLQDIRLLTFKALAQLSILGCTWFLGILQIGPAATIMAYLFTIINSLQGVFIFLVYCLLSHQVQEQYKKWFLKIKPTKSESYILSSKVLSGSTQIQTENQEESINN
ncbi:adhesion G protein-coupled receptor E3-like [Macrotis lagotis]|uniref:adhesion G protein-coupled receptor E3-like n=1 Tax=Macrotis lagotis TaxID=92651 RepID=UPI003D6815F0